MARLMPNGRAVSRDMGPVERGIRIALLLGLIGFAPIYFGLLSGKIKDADVDRAISKKERGILIKRVRESADKNHNGKIDLDEFDDIYRTSGYRELGLEGLFPISSLDNTQLRNYLEKKNIDGKENKFLVQKVCEVADTNSDKLLDLGERIDVYCKARGITEEDLLMYDLSNSALEHYLSKVKSGGNE